jgi:alanine dehydrogenase
MWRPSERERDFEHFDHIAVAIGWYSLENPAAGFSPQKTNEGGQIKFTGPAGWQKFSDHQNFNPTNTMIIGIPKEIKKQEHRVALLPSAAYHLVKRGHQVLVQRCAGAGSGFGDDEYERAGAKIIDEPREIFDCADLIVKVKEPQPTEVAMLRPGQLLFTYLHLAADKNLTETLAQSGATGIAYETIEVNRRLPLLEPMSEIAGRMSVLVGGYYLAKHYGGSGTLLGGVPGVLAGKVVVLGGGTSGVNAARMAAGLGADVTILEVDIERMRYLDITLNTAHTLYSDESHLLQMLPNTDLLIGAVLVPGAKAPKLIRRDMLKLMRPGSVLVDIAIDQGGCAETSRPTSHENPVFVEEGVTHYCVANMPGAYSRTATQALTNATNRYIELLADHGLAEACQRQPALVGGINVMGGSVTHPVVAAAHGLKYTAPKF